MPIRRAIRFAKRHRFLAAATALLMVGAGCVSAVRTTTDQLSSDVLKPLSVPVETYRLGVDAASGTQANQEAQLQDSGLLDR